MRTDQTFISRGEEAILAVSLELAGAKWKVALLDGRRETPAVHAVAQPQAAARVQAVLDLIERHKEKWLLPADVRVVVKLRGRSGCLLDLSCAAGARHRVPCRRSGEHSGRTPQATRQDRQARCHQTGD